MTFERREQQHRFGHFIKLGELSVYGSAKHYLLDHLIFANSQHPSLLAICLSTRGVRTKPGQMVSQYHICRLLGDRLGEPDQTMFGCRISRLQWRGFFRMH